MCLTSNPSILAQYGRAAKRQPGHAILWVICTLSRYGDLPIIHIVMNRRAPAFRLFALLVLGIFGFAQVGRANVHRCPTHDAGVTATTSSHHAAHDAHSSTPADQEHDQCNCLGECCTSAVATNVRAYAQPVLATSVTTTAVFNSCDSVLPPSADHTLPFSIGPPSISFIA